MPNFVGGGGGGRERERESSNSLWRFLQRVHYTKNKHLILCNLIALSIKNVNGKIIGLD